MEDEGVGISGWLLADLVLVLAVVFLAMVPGGPPALDSETTPTPTATRAPTPAPTATPTPICRPEADFSFDQIVVSNVSSGSSVTATDIFAGQVRRQLTKDQETAEITDTLAGETVQEYLSNRQGAGFRIALVEAWGRGETVDNGVRLAERLVDALVAGLLDRDKSPNAEIFLRDPDRRTEWSASYGFTAQHAKNTGRINLYFVRAVGC